MTTIPFKDINGDSLTDDTSVIFQSLINPTYYQYSNMYVMTSSNEKANLFKIKTNKYNNKFWTQDYFWEDNKQVDVMMGPKMEITTTWGMATFHEKIVNNKYYYCMSFSYTDDVGGVPLPENACCAHGTNGYYTGTFQNNQDPSQFDNYYWAIINKGNTGGSWINV